MARTVALLLLLLLLLQSFVAGLEDLPQSVRDELQQLTPWTYVGNAAAQAKQLTEQLKTAK
jgi:hypothetical protein